MSSVLRQHVEATKIVHQYYVNISRKTSALNNDFFIYKIFIIFTLNLAQIIIFYKI